jgi:hypothetical protein
VPILKSANDIFSQGHDAIVRGDLKEAYERFTTAEKKFSKQGDAMNARISSCYASIISIGLNQNDTNSYRLAAQSLRSLGDMPLKIGLHETPSSQLAEEIELLALEKDVLDKSPSTSQEYGEKAKRLQDLSLRFRSRVGSNILVIPELFFKQTVSGDSKAISLAAMAEEALAESLVLDDPKAAAEHYQSARLWWMQAGRQDLAQTASSYVQLYGHAAKCWFCGREVSGETIHFVSMPSNLTDLIKKSAGDSALPSYDQSTSEVYACKGCYGAIYKQADALATQRMEELEHRINVQLNEIRRQIYEIQSALRRMGG